MAALRNAHKAGDTEAANRIASMIKEQDKPATDDFVPTEDALAATPAPGKPDRSFADKALGALEAGATLASGATGGALGFALGSAEGAVGELTGRIPEGEGQKVAEQMAGALTYAPRTEAGQEYIEDISEPLAALPPILGTTPLNQFSRLSSGVKYTKERITSPSARKRLIADEILAGNPNTEVITKMLNKDGKIVTNKPAKKAIGVLAKDVGDEGATELAALFSAMNPRTKASVNKVLNEFIDVKKFPDKKLTQSAFDTAGEATLKRAKAVFAINEKASKQIGNVVNNTKKIVDVSKPIDAFESSLRELGVTFKAGDDGWVIPDFSRSKFEGGSQKQMTVLVNDLINGEMDFKSAHELKQSIRSNIDFDKIGENQVKGASKQMLKDLSAGIDDILDDESPAYNKANIKYAKTINAKKEFDKLLGKDIDITDPEAAGALGAKVRRLDSEAISKKQIQKLLRTSDEALADFDIKFKDDIHTLVNVTTRLENMFDMQTKGSFKGAIKEATQGAVQGVATGPVGWIGSGVRAAKELTAPDFNKKMQAVKTLLNESN